MICRTIGKFTLIAIFILLMGCNAENVTTNSSNSVESIVLDFPHGETRLHIYKNGDAFLFYGALPQRQKIKNGTFNIIELYRQLKTRLHENTPREEWPNPQSKAGMVKIKISKEKEKTYLIFNEKEFTDNIFYKARKNIIETTP